MNKPFLKWAGNKQRILPHLLPHIGTPNRYCEPFGGSLSVALNVEANEYILNDINCDLINLYRNLLEDKDDTFIQYCKEMFIRDTNTKEMFLCHRELFNRATSAIDRSILFVYLNRHCFNGLTRYNKKGKFNVPFGQYNSPSFPYAEMMNFRMVFLQRKYQLYCLSFEDSILYDSLEKSDIVYFDPPYVPVSTTASFTDYSTTGFTEEQHVKLVEITKSLVDRGIGVIISNSDTPFTRELYDDAKELNIIEVSRTISAKMSGRKKVNELIAVF